MVEAIGFKQFFPQANHLLCTWHTNETFKKNFKKSEQKTILKLIQKVKKNFISLKINCIVFHLLSKLLILITIG
jgi:hypothetical protein